MSPITSYQLINQNSPYTLLFLHGWGCNLKYMLPLTLKIKNANSLVIDLPGFGNNQPFNKPHTLQDFVEIIISFLNQHQFKIHGIIGHSFGGKLAPLLALKLKVSFLLLLAPSIYHKRRSLKYYFLVAVYKIIKRFSFFKKYLHHFGSKDYQELNPIMKKTMSLIINEQINEVVKSIKIPTIIIFGKQDQITPKYLGKKIKKRMQDSELILLDGNHFAYLNHINKIVKIIESLVKNCC